MADDYAVEYTDFSTGLDVTSAIEEVPMMSVRNCENVEFDTRGMIAARKCFKLLKTVGGTIKAIFPFYSKGTGIYCLMVHAGTWLYKVTDTAATLVEAVTQVDSAVTFWVPSAGKDCFIFNDGVTLKKYDGTSVTSLGASIGGKYLAIHKDRLCVSGNTAPGTEEVVYISKTGTPNDFSEGIAIRIPTWQGDQSIGLIEYMDKLYMLKYNSIQTIVGNVVSNFTAFPAINNIGALAPKAFDTNGAYIIFIGSDRVCYLFNGTDLQDISSQRVRPYFDAIDTTKIDKISLKVFGAKAYIVLPQTDGTTKTLIYDMARENWTVHAIGDVTALSVFRRNNLNIMTIGVGSAVYEKTEQEGVDEFSGASVVATFELRPVGSDTAVSVKKFRRMFVGATSASPITITLSTDLYPTPIIKPITITKEEEVIRVGLKGRILYVHVSGGSDLKLTRFAVTGTMKAPK